MHARITEVNVTLHDVTANGPVALLNIPPPGVTGALWYACTDGSNVSPAGVWETIEQVPIGSPAPFVPWVGAGASSGFAFMNNSVTQAAAAVTAATFYIPAVTAIPDTPEPRPVVLPIAYYCFVVVLDAFQGTFSQVEAEPIEPYTLPGDEWAVSTAHLENSPPGLTVVISQLVTTPTQLPHVVCKFSTHTPANYDVGLSVFGIMGGGVERLEFSNCQACQAVVTTVLSALPTVQDVRVGITSTCGTVVVWWTLPTPFALATLQGLGITQWVVQNVLDPSQRTLVNLDATSVRIALPAGTRCCACVQYALYGIGSDTSIQTPHSLPSPSLRVYPWPHHMLPPVLV